MTPVLATESTYELLKNEVDRITGMIGFRYPVLSAQLIDPTFGEASRLTDEELVQYLAYLNRELGNFRRLISN